jgi:[acyl-carrier-protein] S-malonyltransferase
MKKIAFLFPGQGSQGVGMLAALLADERTAPAVQSILNSADDALGESISALIAQGPAEALNLTTNTQPAMVTAGVACLAAWQVLGGATPNLVAGHSLGEYSALVAAGVIGFSDAVRLVRLRADAMQNAVPVGQGGMAAILGLSDEAVLRVCAEASSAEEVVEAVNFNAPSQVVIAGSAGAVQQACELAKAAGAKRALPLPVSAPFHSSLMKPAAQVLANGLAQVSFKMPQIAYINNVDVESVSDPEKIKDALVRQAHSPVRWVETIQRMQNEGVTHLIECGPGKVLAGLVKRISDLPVYSIFDASSIEQTIQNVGE